MAIPLCHLTFVFPPAKLLKPRVCGKSDNLVESKAQYVDDMGQSPRNCPICYICSSSSRLLAGSRAVMSGIS